MEEPSGPATIEGYLDDAGPGRIRGWAWRPQHPETPVLIEVIACTGVVALRLTAQELRGDLRAAGKREGLCGFEAALPASGAPFRILARAGSEPQASRLLAEALGEPDPEQAHPSALRGADGVVGWLDRADAVEISGWCHRREPFAEPVCFELVVDGRPLATVSADRWRNDLEDDRQGDGRCGFAVAPPLELYDGGEHELELRLPDGSGLTRAPVRIAFPDTAPERPAPAPAPVHRALAFAHPVISVIVNFYNMGREAERTLHSLSRAYQRDVGDLAYEVLCIDNGSDPPLDPALVASFGPEFRLVRPAEVHPSPCKALNEAARYARGRWLALMIDGAHIVSPGVLHEAHLALRSEPGAIVALRQWFVGGDQRWFSTVGYSRAHEDVLFSRIGWPHSGYRIFDISSPMYESPNSWFDGMGESNCLFVPAELYRRVGGFDEAFDAPGAGFANLDLFRRLAQEAAAVVALVGEASFHQYHGGMTTNVHDAEKDVRVRAYADHYAQMRGEEFASVPPERIRLSGSMRRGSALTSRQRVPAPARLGLSARLRPRSAAVQFDEPAQHYLQCAYVETGRYRETRWRGRELGLAPADLTDLQEVLWRVRPDVLVINAARAALVDFCASILPSLELEGARIVWVGGQETSEPLPPRVSRLAGDPYADETLARLAALIADADHILAVLQPDLEDGLTAQALSLYGRLVTFGSYLVVLGAAFGQPWIGYSRNWTLTAIHRFLRDSPGFVVDRTLNQHFVTTSPSGFLRRSLDPLTLEGYDLALDDLSGL